MRTYLTPGVYREEVLPAGRRELRTGVCGLVGGSERGAPCTPAALQRYDAFRAAFGTSASGGYLAQAVEGFFANGGELCYVVRADLGDPGWLTKGLAALAPVEDVDLVCAPDIMAAAPDRRLALQHELLEHCAATGGRFAILDALPGNSLAGVLAQRGEFGSRFGALYYPWIRTADGRALPPSGHIAGIYARADRQAGFYAAPANQEIAGALDLVPPPGPGDGAALYAAGVNELRALPGRGIRVWGARTLAGPRNAEWADVNVCRLFITVGRWIERAMVTMTFAPNELSLWIRVRRELSDYLWGLWRQGGLMGESPEAAFYVKCDAETNPPEVRAAGLLVTEVGLAPIAPAEFIVARIVQRDGQTAII